MRAQKNAAAAAPRSGALAADHSGSTPSPPQTPGQTGSLTTLKTHQVVNLSKAVSGFRWLVRVTVRSASYLVALYPLDEPDVYALATAFPVQRGAR